MTIIACNCMCCQRHNERAVVLDINIGTIGEKLTEVQQLREDKKKLIQALNSIAYNEYGRPSEMMLIARKVLSEITR